MMPRCNNKHSHPTATDSAARVPNQAASNRSLHDWVPDPRSHSSEQHNATNRYNSHKKTFNINKTQPIRNINQSSFTKGKKSSWSLHYPNKALTILQWNMNGFINNFDELNVIIKEHNPSIISLQETHCPFAKSLNPPKAYDAYFHNIPINDSAKQGIALLIKKNIPHKTITLNSNLQTQAFEIQHKTKFTYINIYLPPKESFTSNDIRNIINQIKTPFILGGDFNAWNTLWGSPKTNKRGELIENALIESNCGILNDGAPTHLSTHNSFTHIDLTCCSADLLAKTNWTTLDDLHNSDHFPILTTVNTERTTFQTTKKTKFKTDHANWPLFKKKTLELLSTKNISFKNNKEAAILLKGIRTAADFSIPQTHPITKRKLVVAWWNPELSILRKKK